MLGLAREVRIQVPGVVTVSELDREGRIAPGWL